MIPYFELNSITLGPLSIPVFIPLEAIALGVGLWRGSRRARQAGVWPLVRGWLAVWAAAGGIAGGLLMKLVYGPYFLDSVSFSELFQYRGSATFGAIFGGLIAAGLYCLRRRIALVDAVRILDVAWFVYPLSWAILRLGCTLVHDHPGIRSESWLAVRYPDWPRYDLGLLSMLLLILLAAAFQILDRQPRPVGFFAATAMLYVGLFRLLLDQLQVDPPRFYGWSVDQYNAVLILTLGASLLPFIWKRHAPETA